MRRMRLAAATAALATLGLAAPASAAETTDTFNYTGAAQTWTVPAGVTQATFDLYGAQGGGFASGNFAAGLGGRTTATISVTPGDSIQVKVGGQGLNQCACGVPTAGFNGGGNGAADNFFRAAGGGGASDIRIGGTDLSDRVLVAGGGGGAGGEVTCNNSEPISGGGGGGENGDPGLASTGNGVCNSVAGGGGKQDATGGTATAPATPGVFGVGGNGGLPGVGQIIIGGGGGGGWYGGGGGLGAAGGGGGSGHGPVGTNFETGVRSGNGLVTVTYTVPPTIADLIDSVKALNLAKGTKNSLLQKLNGAQKNLDSANTAGACDKLASFVSQVKALKGKKVIPASAADDLIAEAEAVEGSVGCG